MRKTLKASFLCLTTLFTAPTLAFADTGQYGPYDYVLLSNEPQLFTNISLWPVNAECTILSDVEDNLIAVKALYKKGAVNDVKLQRGDSMVISVDSGEVLHLKAEASARVELTNEGDEEVTARCYISFPPKKSTHMFTIPALELDEERADFK
ncbi:MAG: hypothetical protein P1U36_00780 [Legionellaceae bacterium]|nr:hypothetical protein [Legionellaceae bacterium]